MKKLLLSIAIVLAIPHCLNAQFDAQFSQYMLHATGFNPAAAGESGLLDVTGQHRLQWIGMPHAGSSTLFNLNTPLSIFGKNHGIGLNFGNDKVGLFTNQAVHLQYSYKIKIGKGTLRAGANLGFLSVGFSGDSARGPLVTIGDYHDILGDQAIPKTAVEGFGFDAGLGLWYNLRNFYLGASYSHLNQPVIDWGDEYEYRPASNFFLTGGYARSLRNKKFVLKPSFLLKTDFTTFQLDLSALMDYNNQYWGGITYRYGDSFIILAGLNITGGLSIGYAYDLPVSRMISANWGSHEILLSYEIELDMDGSSKRKSYKSIRIL